MGEGVIGLFLIIALFYLFIGVNVLSDIFSDAIYQITSKTEDVEIYEESEKGLKTTVGVPIWNAQVAYVTIMALGCSAPEIFLCMYGQFRTVDSEDTLPSTMGPMILVGSASLNLFVGGGLAILGASQAKKVEACGAYAVTACFGTFAYIWLYIVICVNTPYYIDIGEAILTLMFYLILVLSVYATERCVNTRSETEERDANRRRICRHQL
jgi:solute carrier family 8 (sodium/calcium exchanger)